jgi:hypothetical protein
MSETNNRPNKDGSLRGDDKALPSRGTKTGLGSYNPEGKSLDGDATNSQGSFDACSDAQGLVKNKQDRI